MGDETNTTKTVREITEQLELVNLSHLASFSVATRGRAVPEQKCEIRTEYQRDRDRIVHCNSFRRLKHKTQVFLAPFGDHYRTRLTHTLEVAQIARTIARGLRLNEDLAEAISLGHDMGHTPFGHAGEAALDDVYPGGFRHYEQSVRVCQTLEHDGKGLNLTYEVLDGIMCHTRGKEADTLEGKIVKLADKIAYVNHDIEDAQRAGILSADCLPKECIDVLGTTKSKRINTLVVDVIKSSLDTIKMSPDVENSFLTLHEFMFQNVYLNKKAKGEEQKAIALVQSLYRYFTENPDKLPDEYKFILDQCDEKRAAVDYIAGMTDTYAIRIYTDLFLPKGWNKY